MADDFLGYELEEWLPTPPMIGPPLPIWMGITWPWYKEAAPPPAPPGRANLYGKVTDVVTGKAIPDVVVTLDGVEALTGAGGNYAFTDLEPREYVLQLSKEGYDTLASEVVLVEGDNELNVALTPIAAPVLGGTILDATWREIGSEQWHSFPLSVPAYTNVDIKWRVRNNSNCRATFTMGAVSLGRYRLYKETLTTLDPGEEADLIRENFRGEKAGTSGTMTFYLAALAGEVTSTYQPDWYDADLVDSVTLQYSWY